jgi:hypothetical protein
MERHEPEPPQQRRKVPLGAKQKKAALALVRQLGSAPGKTPEILQFFAQQGEQHLNLSRTPNRQLNR